MIRYLKNVKKHTRVILVGRSGGGPSTSFYQALAENGVSYCKGPNKITECPFTGAEFTAADRADGIVYTDAHPGVSVNQLRSLNGALVRIRIGRRVTRASGDPAVRARYQAEAGVHIQPHVCAGARRR